MSQLSFITSLDAERPILNRPAPERITREDIEIDLGLMTADTWADRHKVHKYWGRKPANIVSEYVEYFSRPGELVIDPFAGSSVTVVESARLNRRAIGYDFSPFVGLLGNALLAPPDPNMFVQSARKVLKAVEPFARQAYATTCRQCGELAIARSVGYEVNEMLAVRYKCGQCGASEEVAPQTKDRELSQASYPHPTSGPDAPIYFGWEMQKLKRKGVQNWSDLFTPRNYAIAARLREEIQKVTDDSVKKWLLLALTASLPAYP